jgi:hypothetical protein
MPTPCAATKTLIAAACCLTLLACGQQSEQSPAAPQAEPASAAAVAAAPAPTQAPVARSRDSASKLSSFAKLTESSGKDASDAAAEPASSGTGAGAVPTAAITSLPAASAVGTKGRQLVITASARFGVKNTYQSALAIEDAVLANDGFVVSNHIASNVLQNAEQSIGDGKRVRVLQVAVTGELVVRVPSSKAQAFLRDIASQIESLDQRSVSARDVQFDMLRSQLEAARSQEAQADLGQLVRQPGYVIEKSAVIEARSQVKASRDEARIAQAHLADQVAFSTLSLSLHQSPQVRTTTEADFEAAVAEHRPSLGAKLQRAVANGWHGLLGALVTAVALWPLWLVLMAAGGAVAAYWGRRQRKAVAR